MLAVKENVLPVNIIKHGCSQAELFPMLPNCLCTLSISGCGTYVFVDHGLLQNVVSSSSVENMGFVLIWIDDFGCLSYVMDA